MEKNAISLPDTKPEISRAKRASRRASIWPKSSPAGRAAKIAAIAERGSVAGKGSISKDVSDSLNNAAR